ncbi:MULTISPECIES: DoxX family protein [Acinetobacter]|uniref:DoxX family protein n=1 Tax=Acinetobacter TaxID=469 RepID=UPI0015B773B6|nr:MULTISPECIES: DoxX family protein [Acinetobacter]MBT0887410.1 DoxX family protein [Acinetobacter towneri]MDV2455220.1 DoxX family protein [Acinetobacter towneri]NWJ92817.1 DoxX family protein [Acinetobacter sp. Swhac1]UIZ57695.1 DoxX family protein [Acinetobacter sp. SCLZS86]
MFNPNVVVKSVVEHAGVQAVVSLFARAFLAYLFIVSGWGKIAGYEATVGYMQEMGVSGSLLPFVILLELGGGLALLLGFQARVVGLGLGVFSLVTAFLFHGAPEDALNLMKNIGLAGGFFYIMLYGAGKISLDHLLEAKK